jgi:8-oxo-dGTP pyrophosphatase MutT (NUDIX family)
MNEQLIEELKQVLDVPIGFGREDFVFEAKTHAAVLALFRGRSFLESEILLTLRAPGLVQNPGQVALPGGGIEHADEGDPLRTALRETQEEVGLSAEYIRALGKLPCLPTVTGQYVVDPVLGVWVGASEQILTLQVSEVAHAEWTPVSLLLASRSTEKRLVHGVEMELPVFQWGEHRMWGLTAMIFDLIRRRYDKLYS